MPWPGHICLLLQTCEKARLGPGGLGDSFIAGKPRLWPEARLANLSVPNYDLSPDGKRIAAMLASDDANGKPITHLTFLLNFFDELERRAPEGRQ